MICHDGHHVGRQTVTLSGRSHQQMMSRDSIRTRVVSMHIIYISMRRLTTNFRWDGTSRRQALLQEVMLFPQLTGPTMNMLASLYQ